MKITIESQKNKLLFRHEIQKGSIVKAVESTIWDNWIGCFFIKVENNFIALTHPNGYISGVHCDFDDTRIKFEVFPPGTILKIEI